MKTVAFFAAAATATSVGPIQKVLTLLGDLKSKVVADGEVESAQFQKYSKWCEDESTQKGFDIETATNKKEDLEAELEQLRADISKLTGDVEALAQGISKNEADLASAKSIRAAQGSDFRKSEEELSSSIDELVRAASVLRKAGLGGSAGSSAKLKAALTQIAGGLSTVMNAAVIDVVDKRKLKALMQSASEDDEDFTPPSGAPEAAAYESHSTGIIDTLAELKVKAEQERAELRKDEMTKKHNFEMLAQSLNDQIATQTRDLTGNKATKAKKEEAKGIAEGDLASTTKGLETDRGYLTDLTLMCESKASAWEERQKSRAEELATLAKGIEILSGDKFTAASGRRLPQFVQLGARSDIRARVSELLQAAATRLHSVGLAQLAVRTRAGDDPFGKVKALISDMITRLMTQAAGEADHKQYCDEEKAKSISKREKFDNRVDDQTSRIDVANAGVAKLKEEVADLSAEVAAMDKSLAEATELRQKEKTEYTAAMADYREGQDALGAAISVLQEYYSKEALLQAPKFSGPVFSGAYEKRVDGATGIIGILEVAASDFARMEAEAQAGETAAVKAFTKMKNENEVDRASKTTAIKSKEGEVTRVTNLIADLTSDRAGSQKELDAVIAYLAKLKSKCEHTPMSFEERAARRKQEIESLQDALRLLETEAGTSLLQKARRYRN